MASNQPQTIYLNAYAVPDFFIKQTHLNFDLQDDVTTVKSILDMQRNPEAKNQQAPLVLHGEALTLLKVILDGETLSENEYQLEPTCLTIPELPPSFTLEIVVEIKPQNNKSLMGLYRSRNNYCTQCEAEGFRRITYYLDRPDVLSYFTVTIEADKTQYPYLLSNGNLVDSKDLSGNRHWVKWQDPSLKPCYLFALVAGDFDLLEDQYQTMSGREVALQLFVEKGFAAQGHYALESLKRAMQWDEQTWGREYELDVYMIVAVSDFNMGAMENKGLNIFNTKYVLAKPQTATDSDYVDIEAVIGHEYFHNWSGNRVTCRDWFQITLKEGLTVFRDQCFTSDMTSEAVSRLDVVNIVRNRQFKEDAGPMSHPIRPESYIEINNFYTLTVYRKGAEVIRMVQTLLTKPVFRKALDLYFERYDGQAVTTDDFLSVMEQQSGKDLRQFRHWYSQSGTPLLAIGGIYDATAQTFTLTVKQSCQDTPGQKNKKPFYLPLVVGLMSSKGEPIAMQLQDEQEAQTDSKILIINEEMHEFVFTNVSEKPIPSLLRNFSAPVKVKYDYSKEDLAKLWQYDKDAFVRWDAGQSLMVTIIIEMAQGLQEGWPLKMDSLLVNSFKQLLTEGPDDLDFRSRLLMLPEDSYVHQNMESVDIHRVHQVKKFIKKSLGSLLTQQLLQCYEKNNVNVDYVYDAVNMGQRNLKNLCLLYLVESGQEAYLKLAYQQFESTENMTDMMGALCALNHQDCVEREKALSEFYDRWHKEPLVVNKWLRLQASATVPNTSQAVVALLEHQAFDINNPNNVYALLCTFSENHIHFHETTGMNYQFIADQVLKIQSKNPQVAARLLQPLTYWRNFLDSQAVLMKDQLKRIASHKNLSTDIYEIVNKSLS
ncbi:MAG: aminopeptidase N [Gammaproteobacteria bacterium]|nr:aminopeptidase N [Gammaproteobacteria bacterium]MCH9744002.1 aminopeptidase N [Gammaproteobacteria bacterium]